MRKISNKNFPSERALYNLNSAIIQNCTFSGEEDGESALKECKNIQLSDCYMDLRYPLWHCSKVNMNKVTQTQNCRAALWYSKEIVIENCDLGGIKALRECKNTTILNSNINSAEFGWRNNGINVQNSLVNGEYAFFQSKNLNITNMQFTGKYSFQYCKNVVIKNSQLKTKDAFWHASDLLIENCTVQGEYLGWYSKNLTFKNCTIIGTQPLCYCKNLTLINCKTQDCDLSFEYSEVNADIKGNILSVKNPTKGEIIADSIGEIILGESNRPLKAVVKERNN